MKPIPLWPWLKSKKRSTKPAATRRGRSCRRLCLEPLEDRIAPAAITWDGGPTGLGTDWNDALNWSGDVRPGSSDDAEIGVAFAGTTVTSSSSVSVRSVNMAAAVDVAGGTFTVGSGTSLLDALFTVSGGTLQLNSTVLNGSGLLDVGSEGTVLLSGSTINTPLSNAGTLIAQQTVALNGELTTVAGSVLRVEGHGAGFTSTLTVAAGFTNHGRIELTRSVASSSGDTAALVITTGTLSNAAGGEIVPLAGTGGGNRVLNAVLDNQGTIDVQHGLTITNTGRTFDSTNGAIKVASGKTLTVNGGTTVLGSASVLTGAGTMDLTGTHTLSLPSDLTISSSTAGLSFGGSSVVTIDGPGTLINQRTLTLEQDTVNAPLRNEGTLIALQTDAINGALTTVAGSVLRVEGHGAGFTSILTVAAGFTNHGRIELTRSVASTSSHTATLAITTGTLTNAAGGEIVPLAGTGGGNRVLNAVLDNQGTIDVQHGLTITNTGRTFDSTNGAINVASGKTLTVNGGTTVVGSASVLTGAGTMDLTGTHTLSLPSDLTISSSTAGLSFGGSSAVTINGPGTLINQRTLTLEQDTVNAPLRNEGTLIALQTDTLNGELTTVAGSVLRVEGHGAGFTSILTVAAGFTNHGRIELTRSVASTSSHTATLAITTGTLTNAADGEIVPLAGTGGGNRVLNAVVDNQGMIDVQHGLTINKSGAEHVNSGAIQVGGGNLTISNAASFTTTGNVVVSSGRTFTVSGNYTQTGGVSTVLGTLDPTGQFLLNAGELRGTGNMLANVTSAGVVAPGQSPGQLTIQGAYTQLAAGVLAIEIGGTTPGSGYDRLVVTGSATVDGLLNVSLIEPFAPSVGDNFTIISAASSTGAFDRTRGMSGGDDVGLQVVLEGNNIAIKGRAVDDARYLSSQLSTGASELLGLLPDWATLFNLDQADPSAFGLPAFELPLLTDQFASLFDLSTLIEQFSIPNLGVNDTLDELVQQLEAAGLTVDWIVAGQNEIPAAAAGDLLQVRYSRQSLDLAPDSGFLGSLLGASATDVLEGFVSALNLDADLDLAADLTVELVFGIDTGGFYLSDESRLLLNVTANGDVSASGTIGGKPDQSFTGDAGATFAVALLPSTGMDRIRLETLAGTAATFLIPTVVGNASLNFGIDSSPLDLTVNSTWNVATDSATKAVSAAGSATLQGKLRLPGLNLIDGNGSSEAELTLTGAYEDGLWTLSGTGNASARYEWLGFEMQELAFTVQIGDGVFNGAGTAQAIVQLGGTDEPILIDVSTAFDHDRVEVAGQLDLAERYFGNTPSLLWLEDLSLLFGLEADLTAGGVSAGVTATASTAVFLPEPAAPGETPDGLATALALTGSVDPTGKLQLAAGTVTADVGGLFQVEGNGIVVTLDPAGDADDDLFRIQNAVVNLTALAAGGLTPQVHVGALGLRQGGQPFVSNVEVVFPEAYANRLGVAGVLPFQIESVVLNFGAEVEDFDSFTVTVNGHFTLEQFTDLGFTPYLIIDGTEVTAGTPPFSFELDVLSLSQGRVRPINFGPATLGIAGLTIPGTDTVVNAEITLGRLDAHGVPQPLPEQGVPVAGFAEVISSAEFAPDTRIDLAGQLVLSPTGSASLDLTGNLALEFDENDEPLIGGASARFTLSLDLTRTSEAPFIDVSLQTELLSVTITDVEFDLSPVLTLTAAQATLFLVHEDNQPAAELYDAVVTFPTFGQSVTVGTVLAYDDDNNGEFDGFEIRDVRAPIDASIVRDNETLLDFTNLELAIPSLAYRNGALTGTVLLTADFGVLFPEVDSGAGLTAHVTGLIGALDVSSGDVWLSANEVFLGLGPAIELTGERSTFYFSPPDSAEPADAIATVERILVDLPSIPNFPVGYIDRLVITRSGLSIEDLGILGAIAMNDRTVIVQSQPLTIDVLNNDLAPNGAPLQITGVETPDGFAGAVEIVQIVQQGKTLPALRYTPPANLEGLEETFTYSISDSSGVKSSATVTIIGQPPVLAAGPVAHDDGASTGHDVTLTIDVLANDLDRSGEGLTLVEITQPQHGRALILEGKIVYVPSGQAAGIDEFSYTVADAHGRKDFATVTVALTVASEPPPGPVAVNDQAATQQAQPVTVAVLANDQLFKLPVVIASFEAATAEQGTVVLNQQNQTLEYTPRASFIGQDSFQYTVRDGGGRTSAGTVEIQVEEPAAPLAHDDGASTPHDAPITINVLANDVNRSVGGLTLVEITQPQHGQAFIQEGQVLYIPSGEAVGIDEFSYTIADAGGRMDVATVTVALTVQAEPPPGPVAVNDQAVTGHRQPVVVAVLANDQFFALPVVIDSFDTATAEQGTVVIDQQNQTLEYTPRVSFVGRDSFQYTVRDPGGRTSTASVEIQVEAPPPPLARDDGAYTAHDASITIDVLANDVNRSVGGLTLVEITQPQHGQALIQEGRIVYIPSGEAVGIDEFSYTIADAGGRMDVATVTVAITVRDELPPGPVAVNDQAATRQAQPATVAVLANDQFFTLPVTIDSFEATTAKQGTVEFDPANQTLRYTPKATFMGQDSFQYTVRDANGRTSTAAALILVEPLGQGGAVLVANDDARETRKDQSIALFVLENDRPSQSLQVASVSNPAHGTVVIDGLFDLVYTPEAGFSGRDTFEYTVRDTVTGQMATARVVVSVVDPDKKGFPDLLEVRNPRLIADLTVDLLAGDPLGVIGGAVTVAADGIALFPDTSTDLLDGVVTAEDVSGTINLDTGAFYLSAGVAVLDIGPMTISAGTGEPGAEPGLEVTIADGVNEIATLRNIRLYWDDPEFFGLPTQLVDGQVEEVVIRRDGFSFTVTAGDTTDNDVVTIGPADAPIAELVDPRVTVSVDVTIDDVLIVTGTATVTADSGKLFPDAQGGWLATVTGGIDSQGDPIPGFSGTFDLATGVLHLDIHRFEAEIAGAFDVVALPDGDEPAVTLHYDPKAAGADELLLIHEAQATISALVDANNLAPTVTFEELGLRHNGRFFISAAELTVPAGYTGALGVAGLLPLQIDSIRVDFPDPDNLDTFVLDATGRFLLDGLGLPFTPILQVGVPALDEQHGVARTFEDNNGTFNFQIDVIEGQPRPRNLGPITLGFEGLSAGPVTLAGQITLGGYSAGVFQRDIGGFATITAGANLGASLSLVGTLDFLTDGGATLTIDGTATVNGGAAGSTAGVRLTFEDWIITATPIDAAPFFAFAVTPPVIAQIDVGLALRIGDLMVLTGTAGIDLGNGTTRFDDVTIEFPSFPGLGPGHVDDVLITGEQLEIGSASFNVSGSLGNLLSVGNLAVTISNLVVDFNGAPPEGTVGVDVASATLFPQLGDSGLATVYGIDGSFDFDGTLVVNVDNITAGLGSLFTVQTGPATLSFGSGVSAATPLLDLSEAKVKIPALDNIELNITDFQVHRDGSISISEAVLDLSDSEFLLPVAELLPFSVHEVRLNFPVAGDFSQYNLTVAGEFNFDLLNDLPFTPIIQIGDFTLDEGDPSFEFTLRVDGATVRPYNLGPITLGVADLEVGPATLGGTITLGGYQNGVFVPTFGGSLSVAAGFDNISGDATIELLGAWNAEEKTLDLQGGVVVSFDLEDIVAIDDAGLNFHLVLDVGSLLEGEAPVRELSFDGANVGAALVNFGDLMTMRAENVSLDLTPEAGQPMISFGGNPALGDGSLSLSFGTTEDRAKGNNNPLAGLGGTAGNFGIGFDADGNLQFYLLPDFFVELTIPSDFKFGLPDWLPLDVNKIGLRFPSLPENFDFSSLFTLSPSDLTNFSVVFSGGLKGTESWPITAHVENVEVDLAALKAWGEYIVATFGPSPAGGPSPLVRAYTDGVLDPALFQGLLTLPFPITNLDALEFAINAFDLGSIRIGGGLGFGLLSVDGDPAEGFQEQKVLYGRILGEFGYSGIGAGVELIVTQYGPVLGRLFAGVPIPIGALVGAAVGVFFAGVGAAAGASIGAQTGFILTGFQGGLAFGNSRMAPVDDPVAMLDEIQFPLNISLDGVKDTITNIVQDNKSRPADQQKYTWSEGFTIALSGTLTNIHISGLVGLTGTFGINVGYADQVGVQLFGSGALEVVGMPLASAGVIIDFADPLNPGLHLAARLPGSQGSPLSLLLPSQGELGLSIRSDGLAAGSLLALRTFVDELARGIAGVVGAGVGAAQDFFAEVLNRIAERIRLDQEHYLALQAAGQLPSEDPRRVLTQVLLEGEDEEATIDREFLLSRLLELTNLSPALLQASSTSEGQELPTLLIQALSAAGELSSLVMEIGPEVLADANFADTLPAPNEDDPLYGLMQKTLQTLTSLIPQPVTPPDNLEQFPGLPSFAGVLPAASQAIENAARVSVTFAQALVQVLTNAGEQALDAFFTIASPSITLTGQLQPVLFGIPLGEPKDEVLFQIAKNEASGKYELTIHGKFALLEKLLFGLGALTAPPFPLPISDELEADLVLPFENLLLDLALGIPPRIDFVNGNFRASFAGSVKVFGLEVGQVAGLIFPAGAAEFLQGEVQVDNGGALIPDKILVAPGDYQLLLDHGGVLLDSRLSLPKFITDPFGLREDILAGDVTIEQLADPAAFLQEDPAGFFNFIVGLPEILGQVEQVAQLQVFAPNIFDQVIATFDELTLNAITTSPQSFEDALKAALQEGSDLFDSVVAELQQAVYVSGTLNGQVLDLADGQQHGRLLGIELPNGQLRGTPDHLTVTGTIPWLADLAVAIDVRTVDREVDVEDEAGNPAIETVAFPIASVSATIDSSTAWQSILESLGLSVSDGDLLTGFISAIGASATLRAYSPNFDPSELDKPVDERDQLKLAGGIELIGAFGIDGLLAPREFRIALTPPAVSVSGDFSIPHFTARAAVDQFTIPGLTGILPDVLSLSDFMAEIRHDDDGLRLGLSGDLDFFGPAGITLSADGELQIANDGVYGRIELTAANGFASEQFGLDFEGRFFLEINTASGTRDGIAPGGRIIVTGVDANTPAHLTLLGAVTLDGEFELTIAPDFLQVRADAGIDLGPFGQYTTNGVLQVGAAGVVAFLQVSGDSLPLGLTGSVSLAVNTTEASVEIQVDDPNTPDIDEQIVVDPGLRLSIAGDAFELGPLTISNFEASLSLGGATAPAPLLHWTLDETTGTTANDESGNGQAGILEGGETFATVSTSGKFGTAVHLTGGDSLSVLPDPDLPGTGDSFTVSFWLKLPNWNFTSGIIASYNLNGIRWTIHHSLGRGLIVRSDFPTENSVEVRTSQLPQGQFAHFAIVFSTVGGIERIHINGMLAESQPSIATTFGDADTFTVGKRILNGSADGLTVLTGDLDDFAIFPGSLTTAQIQTIRSRGAADAQGSPARLDFRGSSAFEPFWSAATVQGSLDLNGFGSLSLNLDSEPLNLFGFPIIGSDGAEFTLVNSAAGLNLEFAGSFTFLGNNLTIEQGELSIGQDQLTGQLTVIVDSSQPFRLPSNPLFNIPSWDIHGTFGLNVEADFAEFSIAGAIDIPDVAEDVGVNGRLGSNGLGILNVTADELVMPVLGSTLRVSGDFTLERFLDESSQLPVVEFRSTGMTAALDGLFEVTVSGSIRSDGTFALTGELPLLGIEDKLSIQDASVTLSKTGAALSSLTLEVDGGWLHLPLSEPRQLPALTFAADGEGNNFTLGAYFLDQDPGISDLAFWIGGLNTWRVNIVNGVLNLDLNAPVGLFVLGSSILSITQFHIDSAGGFSATASGQITLLGHTLASATFQMSRVDDDFRLRTNDPLEIDLGFLTTNISGYIESDGHYRFDGNIVKDFGLFTGAAKVVLERVGSNVHNYFELSNIELNIPFVGAIDLPGQVLQFDYDAQGNASSSNIISLLPFSIGNAFATTADSPFQFNLFDGGASLILQEEVGFSVLGSGLTLQQLTISTEDGISGRVSGQLTLPGLNEPTVQGTFFVNSEGGFLTVSAPAVSPLHVDLGLFDLDAYGFISSNGDFSFTGTASVAADFGLLQGDASVSLSRSGSQTTGTVSLGNVKLHLPFTAPITLANWSFSLSSSDPELLRNLPTFDLPGGLRTTAQAPVRISVRDDGTSRMELRQPVAVDLGFLTANFDGWVESDGTFSFTGSHSLELPLIRGSAAFTVSNSGFSGRFTGEVFVGTWTQLVDIPVSSDGAFTAFGITFYLGEHDRDGINDSVEDAAPNGGDGNNDDIADNAQAHVTSFVSQKTGTYVTVASSNTSSSISNVGIELNPPAALPSNLTNAAFPFGFLAYDVNDISAGQSLTVTIYVETPLPIGTKYYKYGPTPDNSQPHWYDFSYSASSNTGAEISADRTRITLHFVDGGRGDDDLQANGRIRDPGAPVVFAAPTRHFQFTDADGDVADVRLGGPGQATVSASSTAIEQIFLENTDARTTLTIAVKKAKDSGDGRVDVGSITGTALKSINARTSNLVGSGIELTGFVGSVQLGDVENGASIKAGGSPTQSTVIVVDNIGPGSHIMTSSRISFLAATSVGDADITAPALGRLAIKRDFDANLTLSSTDARRPALTSASILGGISDAVWSIIGDVGAVAVAGPASDWDLDVSGSVNRISAAAVAGDSSITAAALAALAVRGRFDADLTLSGNSDPRKPTLGAAMIGGSISDSVWHIVGNTRSVLVNGLATNWQVDMEGAWGKGTFRELDGARISVAGWVNSINVGVFRGSNFLVGLAPPFDAWPPAFAATDVGIRSFRVSGLLGSPLPAFANSKLIAPIIGVVNLRSVNPANNGDLFGVFASESINRVIVTYATLTDPASDDFQVMII